jgi:2-oxoglutarate ferredoxin oxidoreductase subunit beta
MGSLDKPFNPISLALGAEAGFVARTIDSDRKHLQSVLREAAAHRGTSLVEIYQNCNIFNDGAFDQLKDPAVRDEITVKLEHGRPIVFGSAENEKAVRLSPTGGVEVVPRSAIADSEILVHDAHNPDPSLAFALSRPDDPAFEHVPIGVFRSIDRPAYDQLMSEQLEQATADKGQGQLSDLLLGGDTWRIT